MTLILDTHFLIWLVLGSSRVSDFSWLGVYRPWGVSPISLLEIQFLAEVGKLRVKNPDFVDALAKDERFVVDDAPLATFVTRSRSTGPGTLSTGSSQPIASHGVCLCAASMTRFNVTTGSCRGSWRSSLFSFARRIPSIQPHR